MKSGVKTGRGGSIPLFGKKGDPFVIPVHRETLQLVVGIGRHCLRYKVALFIPYLEMVSRPKTKGKTARK